MACQLERLCSRISTPHSQKCENEGNVVFAHRDYQPQPYKIITISGIAYLCTHIGIYIFQHCVRMCVHTYNLCTDECFPTVFFSFHCAEKSLQPISNVFTISISLPPFCLLLSSFLSLSSVFASVFLSVCLCLCLPYYPFLSVFASVFLSIPLLCLLFQEGSFRNFESALKSTKSNLSE
jgi:hypothetical protein